MTIGTTGGAAAAAAGGTPGSAMATTAVAPAAARRLVVKLMGGALLGKVLGFVREVMVAQVLGATLVADSFRGAMTGVLLPLILLQNENVPAILIPLYKTWDAEGRATRRFTALTIALTLFACMIMITVELLATQWVDVVVGGFSADGQSLTRQFLRIMALAMPASVLLNCLAAAEISHGRSRLTSIRSAVLNTSVIAGIGLLALTGRVDALAWSFMAAFNALGAWAIFTLSRDGIISLHGVGPAEVLSAGMEFLRRLRPLVVQPMAEQGQVWLERLLGSALAVGTVASLDYARTLTESAVLLVSQPVGLAVLSAGPQPNTQAQMESIARPILALAVPASMFLLMFAPEVVQLVFGRGAFNAHAVLLTSESMRGIATGLWAATLGWILLRMLNSTGRNTLAALILALAFAVNAAANFLTVAAFGNLGLGLSEGLRGIVLVTGAAIALGCGWNLLRLVLLSVPGAAVLVFAALEIRAVKVEMFSRLGWGAAAGILAVAISVTILMPHAWRLILTHGGDIVSRGLKRLRGA